MRTLNNKTVEAVILDMDGLMVDTERLAKVFWRRALEEFGAKLTERQYLRIVGRTAVDSTAILKEMLGADFPVDECRVRMRELYYAEIAENGIPIKAGLLELVDFLKAKSIGYAVATSTARDITIWKLEITGLTPYFNTIVAGDEVANGKPNSEIFLKAASLLGASPERVVVIEDSFNGIRAAHAAKMIPIMVPDLIQPDEEMESLAYAVVGSLHECRELISELIRNRS
jgi:HAD superfamily hydrolase (TIGR01509 family)